METNKTVLVYEYVVLGMTEPLNYVVGTYLVILIGCAMIMNGTVCLAFAREKSLRQPGSYLLVNLSIADLAVSALIYPTSIIASFMNTWPFGEVGCIVNGFGGFVFNASNMITMALLAIERYCLVCRPIQAMKWWTVRRMYVYIALTWMYVTIVSICPLFGWSRYVPEPYGLSCTVDWFRRTPANVSYIVFVFFVIFFIPVIIMVVCYSKVVLVIFARRRVANPQVQRPLSNQVTETGNQANKNMDHENYMKKVVTPTLISIALVVVFLICWTPYAVVSFLGQLRDSHTDVNVDAYAIAPMLAKSACLLNPLIYGLGHSKFRDEIRKLLISGRSLC